MYVLISLILAIAPAIYLVRYFYKLDVQKPEPRGLIIKMFLLGVLCTIPVAFLEQAVHQLKVLFDWWPPLYHFFMAFIVAALCEESIKLLLVKVFVYRNDYFDEVMDGIVYTVVVSLGFACLENILYVVDSNLGVALFRAFTAIPLHALCSGIMGYYVGMAKFSGSRELEKAQIRKGLWIAILIHGFYDFPLLAMPDWGGIPALGIFPLLVCSYWFLKHKMKRAMVLDRIEGRS